MRDQLSKLKLEDVNAAIKKYLTSDKMRIVMVTKNGAALRDALANNTPSPMKYNAPKPKEITDEDKTIESYKINIKAADITLVPVEKVFQ